MRASMLLIMTYPGKKMLFMGTEYGQFREWDYENALEWFMLDYPNHSQMREYVASLNRFYLETKELWMYDFTPDGFEWINADAAEQNSVSFKRKSKTGEISVAINFSGSPQTVRIPLNKNGTPKCIFATDLAGMSDGFTDFVTDEERYIEAVIPPFSGKIFKQFLNNKKIKI